MFKRYSLTLVLALASISTFAQRITANQLLQIFNFWEQGKFQELDEYVTNLGPKWTFDPASLKAPIPSPMWIHVDRDQPVGVLMLNDTQSGKENYVYHKAIYITDNADYFGGFNRAVNLLGLKQLINHKDEKGNTVRAYVNGRTTSKLETNIAEDTRLIRYTVTIQSSTAQLVN